MSIKIICKNCHTELEAEDEFIGTECQCPVCNADIVVEKTARNILNIVKPTVSTVTKVEEETMSAPLPSPPATSQIAVQTNPEIKRTLAILLACACGTIGLHLIYIKQYKAATTFIAMFLISRWIPCVLPLVAFLSALHAVSFGKASDEDFQREFVDKKRGWFFN